MKIYLKKWIVLLWTGTLFFGCASSKDDDIDKLSDLYCRSAEFIFPMEPSESPEKQGERTTIKVAVEHLEAKLEEKYTREELEEIRRAAENIAEECIKDHFGFDTTADTEQPEPPDAFDMVETINESQLALLDEDELKYYESIKGNLISYAIDPWRLSGNLGTRIREYVVYLKDEKRTENVLLDRYTPLSPEAIKLRNEGAKNAQRLRKSLMEKGIKRISVSMEQYRSVAVYDLETRLIHATKKGHGDVPKLSHSTPQPITLKLLNKIYQDEDSRRKNPLQ